MILDLGSTQWNRMISALFSVVILSLIYSLWFTQFATSAYRLSKRTWCIMKTLYWVMVFLIVFAIGLIAVAAEANNQALTDFVYSGILSFLIMLIYFGYEVSGWNPIHSLCFRVPLHQRPTLMIPYSNDSVFTDCPFHRWSCSLARFTISPSNKLVPNGPSIANREEWPWACNRINSSI